MQYHPADTCALYKTNKEQIDQLWYKVNYFQLRDNTGESKIDHEPLSDKLFLNNEAKKYILKTLGQRNNLLLKQQDVLALKVLRGKISGRLVHGLGGAHARVTAITLHPIYGVPYIPGSSIKGTVLNWAVQAFFIDDEKVEVQDDIQKEANKLITEIFGSQEQAGRVEFFDAFAAPGFNLIPDIMTPHFGKYYSKGESPSDSDKPVPVAFYTLKSDYIEFIIGVKRRKRNSDETDTDTLLDLVKAWMENALMEMGIGSKTSSGYGFFSEFTDVTEQALAKSHDIPALLKTNAKITMECQEKADITEQPESGGGGLVGEIKRLKKEDSDKSKSTIYQKVLEAAEQGDIEPAKALKEFWITINEWDKTSKKQRIKVQEIKNILKE